MSPNAPDNVDITLNVGINWASNLSRGSLRNSLNFFTCARRTFDMSSGLLQDSSCSATEGSISRRCPDTLWYSTRAVSNVAAKLTLEGRERAVWLLDMRSLSNPYPCLSSKRIREMSLQARGFPRRRVWVGIYYQSWGVPVWSWSVMLL